MMRNPGFILLWLVMLTALTLACAAQTYVNDQDLFESIKQRPRLTKGAILIAGRNLHDPNFSHTVVLITEYNDLGTTGLVINRPMNMAAKQVFPPISQVTPEAGKLFIGGPIGFNNLQILVESGTRFQRSASLTGNIYLINNPRTFDDLTEHGEAGMKIKILAGYAGWGVGQLESEIMRKDWHIWHADSRIVFSNTPEAVWNELIELVTVQWAEYN
jgi:putative transcriptional regulator